jgi:hypothetical protein
MDATSMKYENNFFDFIIDKGTLDAILVIIFIFIFN